MGIETGIGTAIATAAGLTTATGGLTAAGTALAIAINLSIAAGLSVASSALAGTPEGPRKGTRTGNLKNPLSPHEVVYGTVRKGGPIFYVTGSHFANTRLHMCIALAAHECEEIESIYINGKENDLISVIPSDGVPPYGVYYPELGPEYQMYVPDTGHARREFSAFNWRLGTATQDAIPGMVRECDTWSADHRARGVCYLYARLVYDVTDDSRIWPSFIPSMTVRMQGRKDIYDPRTDARGWTDNPALIAANVLEMLLGVPLERIDMAALEEAADICDEVVPLKEGGTEKRYRCSGYFSLEGEPENWLEPIVRTMAGACIEHHGTYYIHAGKWRAPEITITDDDVMGGLRVRTAQSDRERANIASGIFASAETYDQPTEFPRVVDAAGVTEDGLELEMDIDLEFVPTNAQAQRVAKILLLTQRAGRTIEVGTNLLKGLDVKPWDTVNLNLAVFGLTGTFRVIEHSTSIEGSPPVVRPKLILQEISEAIYAWDEETEEQPLALQSPIIPGMDLEPDDISYAVTTYASNATQYKPAQIFVSWTNPNNTIFEATEVQVILHVESKLSGGGSYAPDVVEVSGEVSSAFNFLTLDIVDDDQPGNWLFQAHQLESVRIRARISPNNWSDWVEFDGDLRAPVAVIKTFTAYTSKPAHKIGAVKMVWTPPTDGSPISYEVEAKVEYEWKQGAGAWTPATYIENRVRVKARKINLVLWDKSQPGGSTQFQNHTLVYARVRSINGDGTVSAWTNL